MINKNEPKEGSIIEGKVDFVATFKETSSQFTYSSVAF